MSDKYDEDMERARALLACDRPAESEYEAVEARVQARVLQAIRDGAPYNVDAINKLRGDRPAETPQRYNCDCLNAGRDGRPTDDDAGIYCQRWVYLAEDVERHLAAAETPAEQKNDDDQSRSDQSGDPIPNLRGDHRGEK